MPVETPLWQLPAYIIASTCHPTLVAGIVLPSSGALHVSSNRRPVSVDARRVLAHPVDACLRLDGAATSSSHRRRSKGINVDCGTPDFLLGHGTHELGHARVTCHNIRHLDESLIYVKC